MLFYTHHIGDFAVATQYLTMEELGIYVRLRDQYLMTEMPLQCDWIAIAMRTQCEQSVKNVLNLMFKKVDDCWVSESLDKIIDGVQEKSNKAAKSAKARWEKRKSNADAMQTECERNANACETDANECERNANAMLTNKPINQITNKEKIEKKKSDLVKPVGVNDDVFDAWVVHKKQVSKAKPTQRMVDAMVREAAKAGISTNQAMELQLENGWQGFRAEYVKKSDRDSQPFFENFSQPDMTGLIENEDGSYSF